MHRAILYTAFAAALFFVGCQPAAPATPTAAPTAPPPTPAPAKPAASPVASPAASPSPVPAARPAASPAASPVAAVASPSPAAMPPTPGATTTQTPVAVPAVPQPTVAAAAPTLPASKPQPTTVTVQAGQAARGAGLQYGLSVFVWGNPNSLGRDLDLVKSSGFGWQKSLFQWRAVENQRGQYNWTEADRVVQESNARGIKVLARLDFQPEWARQDGRKENGAPDDPADFARFAAALAERYKPGSPNGVLHAIQVWNEPNLQREWGGPITPDSAAAYVRLLGTTYTAVKRVNPDMIVVSAGLSPTGWDDETARPDDVYLRWLFEAGMAGKYDALGLHANAQAPEPLAEPNSLPRFNHPSFYFRRVEQMRTIQEEAGDGGKPVWILEFGWTADRVHEAYAWFAVTEEKKAENIVTALRYAAQNWQSWIGPMFLWVLPDPAWNEEREEYWWAIANNDGTPRPALTRFQQARASGELP